MTDEALVETTARRLDADGVSIVVVSFVGEYGYGCQGNGDAHKMEADLTLLLAEHEDADALVLDGTRLGYQWGDEIGRVMGDRRPYVWAVSEQTSGLTSYFAQEMGLDPSEWLFASVDAAVAEVRARAIADAVDLHDADGAVCERWRREPRGRRQTFFAELEGRRLAYEALYARAGRLVELLGRDEDGALRCRTEWPFPDAQGGENEACRVGARLAFEAGVLQTIDWNPQHTGRPLPADWLTRVAARPTVKWVVLDETGVSDREIDELLARSPGLERVWLNGLRLEGAFLMPPSPAERLHEILLLQGSVPGPVARAFAKANPKVYVGYDEMWEKE